MKTYALIFVALTQLACGAEETEIDYQLQPIFDRYMMFAPDRGRVDELVSVKIGNPELMSWDDGKVLGYCYKDDQVTYKGTSYLRKLYVVVAPPPPHMGAAWKAMVTHELAHCIHNKKHVDDEWALMAEYFKKDDDYWEANLDDQLVEMFYETDYIKSSGL